MSLVLYFPCIYNRFSLLTLRGFTRSKHAIIKPVAERSDDFLSFLLVIFEMIQYEEENGMGD